MSCKPLNGSEPIPSRLLAAGLEQLGRTGPVQFRLDPVVAWAVLGFLQLALRHPEASRRPSAEIVRGVAREIQRAVAPSGPLADLAEAGWDPKHDVRSSKPR